MLRQDIGKLIKYDNTFWLIEEIRNGEAELWFNGVCIFVPLDDLEEKNVVNING